MAWYDSVDFSPDVELLRGLQPGDRILRDGLEELVVLSRPFEVCGIFHQLMTVWADDFDFDYRILKDFGRDEFVLVRGSVRCRTYSLLKDGSVWDKWVAKVHQFNFHFKEGEYRALIADPSPLKDRRRGVSLKEDVKEEVTERKFNPWDSSPDRVRGSVFEENTFGPVPFGPSYAEIERKKAQKIMDVWDSKPNPFDARASHGDGYVPYPENEEESFNNRMIEWGEVYADEADGKYVFNPFPDWSGYRSGCWEYRFEDDEPSAEDLEVLIAEDIEFDQFEPRIPEDIELALDEKENCWYRIN